MSEDWKSIVITKEENGMTFDKCFGCMQKLETPDEVCPYCGFDIEKYDEAEFALRPGTILHGRYVVGKVLGKGGFGITYIGYDMSLDIKVAIKEYYPEGFVGRDARQSAKLSWYSTRTDVQNVIKSRESLIKEARNMAKIDTFPTLVRVRDVLVANETAYLIMDYVEGETLKNLVMKTGTLSYEKVCTYLFPIMEDLSKIHEKGIIHRDISPDNIMIEVNGQMHLLDLGAAKDLYRGNGIQGKANEQIPVSTQMVLKHGFSPMEQYRMHGEIGPWTDVYAMTATIYYLMSGKILPTPMDRLDKEQEDAVQNMINKMPMPENAKEGMKKGLAILKNDRIKSMKELQKYFPQKGVEPKPKKLKKFPVFLLGMVIVAGVSFTGIKLSHKSAEKYYEEGNYEQALEIYRKEKDVDGVKKTLQTMYDTARNYLDGTNGYEKSEEEAVKYYKLVAEDESVEEDLEKKSCSMLGYIMSSNETEDDDAEAVSWLEKATEKGDFSAAGNLAIMYGRGQGVTQDYKKAMELLEWSADNGISGSMHTMGWVYEYGNYGQQIDIEKALKWYETAGENKYEDAESSIQRVIQTIYDTAENYRTGSNGYEKNEEEAIKYYKLVAEDENVEESLEGESCRYLGLIMENNETDKDDMEGVSWYKKASEKGDIIAMNNLAFMYAYGNVVEQDYTEAMKLFKQAADGGNNASMINIGYNYEFGECGQQIDLEEALKWYKKAKEDNYDSAEESVQRVLKTMYEIAQNYRIGDNGYEKNEEEAIKYYKIVAEDGDAENDFERSSCYFLGLIMEDNETEEDDIEAVSWYEKAIQKGSLGAANNLALMYEYGEGVTKDYKKAMELFKQAADGGNSTAMINIGYNYEFGECGQKMDLKKALKWYKKAEKNDDDDAKELIQRVQSKLESGSDISDTATEAE